MSAKSLYIVPKPRRSEKRRFSKIFDPPPPLHTHPCRPNHFNSLVHPVLPTLFLLLSTTPHCRRIYRLLICRSIGRFGQIGQEPAAHRHVHLHGIHDWRDRRYGLHCVKFTFTKVWINITGRETCRSVTD